MTEIAVVTGADRGLGAALVEGLLGRGFRVFAGVLGPGESLLPLVVRYPTQLVVLPLDVRSDVSVADAAQLVSLQAGHVDVLINNAGILGDFTKSIHDGLDFQDMKATYDVNALGPLRVSAAFYALVAAGRRRLVVNISSEAGSLHQTRIQDRRIRYGYCMSKSALNAGSVILQNSARDDGIRVLLVEPGWIRSFMHGDKNLKAELEPEESAEAILTTLLSPLAPELEFITRKGEAYEF